MDYTCFIKLFIMIMAVLITGTSGLSRKWYVNLPIFIVCTVLETCLAWLFFLDMGKNQAFRKGKEHPTNQASGRVRIPGRPS